MGRILYLNSDRPDNSGNGLTPQTAKKTPRGITDMPLQDGDTVLVARDRFYDPTGGYFPILRKKDVTWAAYGEGERPCFDALTYEAADATGWTLEDPVKGIWSKAFGVGLTRRVFVGAFNKGNRRGQRSYGTAVRRARDNTGDNLTNIKANLNKDDVWWSAGSGLGWKIYIWTGSATVAPPQYYNGLAFVLSDTTTRGAASAFQIFGPSENLLFMSIDSWGAATYAWSIRSNTTDAGPVKNINVFDCYAYAMWQGHTRVQPIPEGNLNPRQPITDILIDSCYGDAATNPLEQEPNGNYSGLSGAMDMFVGYDLIERVKFKNCVSVNSLHVAFGIGAYYFNSHLPKDSGFENCTMYASPWHTYARGLTSFNVSDSCYARNMLFDGQSVRSQLAGNFIISNFVMVNFRASVRSPNRSGVFGLGAEIIDRSNSSLTAASVGNERFVYCTPTNVQIENGLIVDPKGPVYQYDTWAAYNLGVPEPTILDGAVTSKNIVVYERGRGAAPVSEVYNRATTIGVQNYINCRFYRGDGQGAATQRIENNGALVPLSDLGGSAGLRFDDPKLILNDLTAPQLPPDSPCRDAGVWTPNARDAAGLKLTRKVSIGPFGLGPIGSTLRIEA